MNVPRIVLTAAAALTLAVGVTAAAGASTTAARSTGARTSSTPVPSIRTFGAIHLAPGIHRPPTHPQHASPVHPVLLSGNWSGYAVQPKAGFQSQFIVATWNIPSVNCAATTSGANGNDAANWVGLDGAFGNSNTVEQDGTDSFCSGATPEYDAWYEMYPLLPVSFTGLNPGDAIQAAVRYLGSNSFVLTLTDVTQHSGFDVHASCPSGSSCLKSSAEVITEDPGGSAPSVDLSDYGMINFDSARTQYGTHNGGLTTSTWWTGNIQFLMEDPSSVVMAQPSALFGGQAFTTTWKVGS